MNIFALYNVNKHSNNQNDKQQMKKRFFTTLVALSAFLAVSADDYFDEQGGFCIRPFAGINVSGITVLTRGLSPCA